MMLRIFVIVCLILLIRNQILPFNKENIDTLVQGEFQEFLILVTKGNDESKNAISQFKEYDATKPQIRLFHCDSSDEGTFFQPLLFIFGIGEEKIPSVMYINNAEQKYLYNEQTITKNGLFKFHLDIVNGNIEQFIKTAPEPQQNNEAVKVLVGSSFEKLVMKSKKEILVKFYSADCGHCKSLAPHYIKAAKYLQKNPNIVLADFDAVINDVKGVNIEGYPTIMFYKKNKRADPIKFEGQRTVSGIIQWIKNHTQFEWVDLGEVEELTEEQEDEYFEELNKDLQKMDMESSAQVEQEL